jgi:predicted metal-dependent phosphoesterase TrpH
MNIDLHCHSTVSDGLLTPSEVAWRAKSNGVDLLALTDHDEVRGLSEAADAARDAGLRFVPGVEISVTYASETVHILGLRIDAQDTRLVEGLTRTRSGREQRGREMGRQLADVGIEGVFEGALKYVGNPELISRTHFARYLVEAGVCRDVREVFTKYLVYGKPGYVPMQWAALGDALTWIRDAGGVAVVAHPGRYRYDQTALMAFLDEFKDRGGVGIEVVTGSHTPDQYRRFAQLARDYGFLASRGSDFHGPEESRVDLGRLPPLPEGLTPVWHDWDEAREVRPS